MVKLELRKLVLLELLPMIISTYDDKAIDTIQYPFMTPIFKCLRKKRGLLSLLLLSLALKLLANQSEE